VLQSNIDHATKYLVSVWQMYIKW